ncbi:MAG: hypothetical protein ABIG87_03320 [Patescibacteria group bacterium]
MFSQNFSPNQKQRRFLWLYFVMVEVVDVNFLAEDRPKSGKGIGFAYES